MTAARQDSLHFSRWLVPARLIWVGLAVLTVVMVAAAAGPRYESLLIVSPESDITLGALQPEDADALRQLGLTVPIYAAYFTAIEILSAAIFFTIATIIFLNRSSYWMAWLVSLAGLSFGAIASPLLDALVAVQPGWAFPLQLLRVVSLGGTIVVFFLFPNGRFVPGWTRWIALAWALYTLSWLFFPSLALKLTLISTSRQDTIIKFVFLGVLISGAYAQIYRYMRVSNAIQAQQTKWAVYGTALAALLAGMVGVPLLVVPALYAPTSIGIAFRLVAFSVTILAEIILAASVGVSLLRYRLWDVDILIRRTLLYTGLSTTLAGIYFLGIISIKALIPTQTQLATALATLAIAGLFTPLRRRIQRDIDLRFYRRAYDIEKTMEAFGATAREEVDLDTLASELTLVVQETMQPSGVSLWLARGSDSPRPADGKRPRSSPGRFQPAP